MDKETRLQAFKSRFHFIPKLDGHLGVEREWFIEDEKTGLIVPRSPEIMATLTDVSSQFTFELSACQGESRHGPCELVDLKSRLIETDELLRQTLRPFGLRPRYIPVAPAYIPLDVYPTERYQRIVKTMRRETLAAACRSAGVHIHVGKRDHDQALADYNAACELCTDLVYHGDLSNRRRFKLYETVQPRWRPRPYLDWQEFFDDAVEEGFEENPRDNWRIIRLTGKGTLEYRMFDTTDDVDTIVKWAEMCLEQ